MKNLYTVGYSGYTINEFIEKIKAHNIDLIIDVRAVPRSRKKGFSKNTLTAELKHNNIHYMHFVDLGTPRELLLERMSIKDDQAFFKKYTAYVNKNTAVKKSLSQLKMIVKNHTAALLCLEAQEKNCHRHILAQKLANEFKIMHI